MNTVEYVTEYEYASFALLAVLMGLYATRRKFHTVTNRLFLAMMAITFLSVTLHILTTKTLPYAHELPLWLNYFFHVGYLLAYDLIGIIYLVYVTEVTKHGEICLQNKVFTTSMMILYIALILPTPWTKLIIYFDREMNYCHGPLFNVLPAMGALIYIYSMGLFIRYKKKLKLSQTLSIVIFTTFSIFAIVVQLIWPSQIIANFGIALSMIMFFVSLENPADYIDKTTGCMNAEAFYISAEGRIKHKMAFSVTAFRAEGLNYFTELLGFEESARARAEIAGKLKASLKAKEFYYLGDWEFAVIGNEKNTRSEVLVKQIFEFFAKPLSFNGTEAAVTPYICTLHYPDFAKTVEDVRDALDYTLKSMKKSSVTYAEATPEAIKAKQRELRILSCMKQCILNDSFEMYYQPLYDIKKGGFLSAEALIRMRDSELGFVSPEEFIPLAEVNGLIVQIGELAFRSVCRFLQSGKVQKLGVEYIEVNLSVIQCVQEKLASQLIAIMNEYGIDPRCINFEITETAGLANYEILLKNMRRLIAHGVSFSMDDYGTGFSTANYLIALPTNIVKIDKSILWPAMKNKEAFIILKHTVEMLKSLKKEIVVEGVETAEMVKILSEIGCDYLQGYYYSKPVPADEYVIFLERNASANRV